MAVNKVDAGNGKITLHGDYVVHHEKHVDFSLEGDRLPAFLKGTHSGDIFITNMRMIFVNKGSKGYNTFSMDFQYIRNTEVKQPIFGCNNITGFIRAEPNGGWEGNANFKVNFPKGGAIEFAEKFQRAVKDAMRLQRNNVPAPVPPQPGFYPPPMMGAPNMMAPPQMGPPGGYYYPPPQPGYYQYQTSAPPQGAPTNYAPPNNSGQAPPPYQQPPMQGQGYADHPKAQEAYMSGNTAYVPNEAPPPYNPHFVEKKDQ